MKYILIISSMLFSFNLSGQFTSADTDSTLVLGAKLVGDSIVIRWVPTDRSIWEDMDINSFSLLKKTLQNGQVLNVEIVDGLRLGLESEWDILAENNRSAEIARAILYESKDDLLDAGQDGIHPLDIYMAEENLFHFSLLMADLSLDVAKLSALGYVDNNVDPLFQYAYSVHMKDIDGQVTVESKDFIVDGGKYLPLKEIDSLDIEVDDKALTLSWPLRKYDSTYVAYTIERSLDGGSSFEKANDLPYIGMTAQEYVETAERTHYLDTLLENHKKYVYRVTGITPYGEKSQVSDTISGIPLPPPVPTVPFISDVYENDRQQFEVTWYFEEEYINQITGFYVMRSISDRDHYEVLSPLLPTSTTTFIDESPGRVNFYKIVAYDINGYIVASVAGLGQLKDNTPPAIPDGLTGTIDSSGVVSLTWNMNEEYDFSGYYVFVNNGPQGEYAILTRDGDIPEPFFTDTIDLKNLTEKIYYKVMALDFRGNQSGFSEYVEIEKPDIIPPVPPLFKKCNAEKNGVLSVWTNSSSHDIEVNTLQKYDKGDWVDLISYREKGTTVSYRDTTVSNEDVVAYRIVAIDDDGLQSLSDERKVKPIPIKRKTNYAPLFITVDQENNQVKLDWTCINPYEIKYLSLYRSEGRSKKRFVTLHKVDDLTKSDYTFTDSEVLKNINYTYQIVVRFKDGSFYKSPQTDIVTLK